jgi:hypothetical protein
MKRKCIATLVVLGLFSGAYAGEKKEKPSQKEEELNQGLIYGEDHSFWLSAPKGWVLDNQAGVSQGLHAVFYPKGSTWATATTVMYANVAHKGKKGEETLQAVMDGDAARFRERAPQLVVKRAKDLTTRDEKKAVVRYFSGDAWGSFEAVAYLDEKKVIVILVMTSKTRKGFEASLPVFAELVGSYAFMTENVKGLKKPGKAKEK